MANQRWLDEVQKRLAKNALPPCYIRRFMDELSDHFQDLTEETMDTEANAWSRLGEPNEVARAAVTAYRRRSFLGRHPTAAFLVFAISPLVALVAAFSLAYCGLFLLIRYPCLSLCEYLEIMNTAGKEMANARSAGGVAAGVLMYGMLVAGVVAPCCLVSFLYCKLARRLGIAKNWMLASSAVLAGAALVPGYYIGFTDLSGHVPWSYFLMAHFQQLCQIVAPLGIVWWFMRRTRHLHGGEHGEPALA